jgi:signal transduction histidine kinase
MTLAALSGVARRLWPRRVRTRLAVLYAVLFLLAGTALLAVTYTVLASVLLPAPASTSKSVVPRTEQLLGLCKQRESPGEPPMSASLLEQCNRAYAAAGAGTAGQRSRTLSALRSASVIGLGVLAIASAGLGWLVSGRALRPVRSITEAARRASELRLGQRLALTGPDDELKQLADTFDVMLERLDAAFTSQKRFVANAAHELRTPLTAMRTAIEVTLSKPTRTPDQLEAMAARVKRSVERAEATVEALLTLATSELGPTAQEAIDLATAAEDALDATHTAIDQRHIKVEATLEPALARGDRVLFERMIANLIENAVRHNNPGGWIGLRTMQQADSAVFEIANTGPSVPAEEIPTLFEPFARAKQRLNFSDGVGLGLSIANAIARAHNATITARPRPGGGLEMSVTIPGAGADTLARSH